MLNQKLLKELEAFVASRLEQVSCQACYLLEDLAAQSAPHDELEGYINKTRQPEFRQVLFNFIDQKGATDTTTYKRAGLDRRHFSKIRSHPGYRPGKNTVIALAMALELDKKEAEKLLGAAGYTLSESEIFDLVISFCLEKKIHDLHDVNQALDYFSLQPLQSVSGDGSLTRSQD